MPPRTAKLTITKYVDSRDSAAVSAAEAAGYKKVIKTMGVQAEIRGYLLSQAGKLGLITSTSFPTNIQKFMDEIYPAAFKAFEKYSITVNAPQQNPATMEVNNTRHVEEHFIKPEEVSAMQEVIHQAVPELSEAQSTYVSQYALAMGSGEIDVELEELLDGLKKMGLSGGRRRKHATKYRKHRTRKQRTRKQRTRKH